MSYVVINNAQQLQQCCEALAGSEFLALDTEFLREKTYYPKLALIQVANTTDTFIIDPLAIDDLQSFFDLINDPAITKVLHSARQDYEIFYQLQGKLPSPIFDTQIAASLLGHGEQIGYANLVKALLGIEVDKSQTRTDWTRRPLNNKQLDYAASDVIYLAQIYPMLRDKLLQLQRLDWLSDDFAELTSPATFEADGRTMWKKIKAANRLPARKLAVVQELADWREQQAISQNRPRKHILSDDNIVDIANQLPGTLKQLKQIRQLNPRLTEQQLDTLLQLIQTGLARPDSDWPRFPKVRKPSAEQTAIADILSVIVQIEAAKNEISPAFICNKKDLVNIVCGEESSPLYSGWRQKLVGASIKRFLAGESNIHLENKRLILD